MPWAVLLDGKPIATDDRRIQPMSAVFSPDSKRVAFRIVVQDDPPRSAYGFMVIVDGVVGAWYPDVQDKSLRFSEDSQRFVYVAGDVNDNFFVVEDGKPGQPYNYIEPESLRFSGTHFGFVAGTGPRGQLYAGTSSRGRPMIMMGQPTLIVDGRALPGFGGTPVFSADGARVAYVGGPLPPLPQPATASGVVVDGKSDPPLRDIMHLQFSPAGKHYAYVGAEIRGDVRRFLVIDGASFKPFGDGYVHRMTIDDAGVVTVVMDDGHGVYRRVALR
jgi:hypothetical protein